MEFNSQQYSAVVREDCSLILLPSNMPQGEGVKPGTERIDFSNRADKGFEMSSQARRKIRSACFSLYNKLPDEQRVKIKFVTLTYPALPKSLLTGKLAKKVLGKYKKKQAEHNGLIYQQYGDEPGKLKSLLMVDLSDKQLEDMVLHELFKLFLDSERKNYSLKKWVWINERQDGARLKDSSKAREVLHYHCLFSYGRYIDYRLVNLRWLNLLQRNNFEIFNNRLTDTRKRDVIYKELAKGNYRYFLKNWDSFYLVNKKPENLKKNQVVRVKGEKTYGRIISVEKHIITVRFRTMKDAVIDRRIMLSQLERKENYFLAPLQVDKRQITDIDKLAKYLAAYLTKDAQDKVYCRRWHASRGLVLDKKAVTGFFRELAPGVDMVNYISGEVTPTLDVEKIVPLFELSGVKPFEIKIEMTDPISHKSNTYKAYYYPPAWLYWRQSEEFTQLFYKHFKINLQ